MKKVKRWLGIILGIWTILTWLPDALEKYEATVKYGKWLYTHTGDGHISAWLWKIVVPLIGLGLILSDPVERLLYRVTDRRRLSPRSPMERLEDRDLYERGKNWLEKRLSDRKMRAGRAFLFGSVVYDHFPTRDVDVLVVIRGGSDRASARAAQRIKDLRKEFSDAFSHELHVQLFLAREEEGLRKFLSRLSKYEQLRLR
jgi:predicted nucleotidyltransferase